MHVSVTKFQDEIAEISFKYVVKRHVFDKISTEFRGILRAFVNFATSRNTTSPELGHFHDTNWRLKICIWRLYFSSWSPKGDLRIFLISSPVFLGVLSVVTMTTRCGKGSYCRW